MCEMANESTKTRPELWSDFHKTRTSCPVCHKSVTMRTLRWRHRCGQKARPTVELDAARAVERLEELERRVRESLARRLGAPEVASN